MTVALLGGFLLPALLTLLLTKPLSPKVARSIWSCVQEIDNPLVPWPEVYTSEKKPALSEVRRALQSLRRLTWGISIFNIVVFLGLWQILGPATQTIDFNGFVFYVESIEIWTFLSTTFCLAFPLVLLVSYLGAYLRHQIHRLRMVIR
ncbi:urea active transporter-like protein [Echinococcus granulosus]|uniref:Urea active transporter-like protein n=1 Tax=Echinococcus granulosus TaxID=6210 RepID=W6U2I7_ECHGR|nr:urea active transporter-like protein [Echinococcus granulosus]EUB54766.1 urea active transporter-like protein [Echinococcus granulosus]